MNQRRCEFYLPAGSPGMIELPFGKIDPHGMSTSLDEPYRPLCRPAAQFQNVDSLDFAQNVQVGLSDSPNAPRHRVVVQEIAVLMLVLIALAIPQCAILIHQS